MLASRIKANTSDDDDDEVQSTMPGNYEPWPRPTSRVPPRATVSPPRPSIPPTSRTTRRPPPPVPKPWPPVTRRTSPVRSRRRRRRSITPEIVIEPPRRRHLSSRGHRIITISLDNRPTLGLRGPPKRVLEIERIPCRRRRRHRSSCYEYDYDLPPPPPPMQLQPNVVFANPISNSYLSPAQPSLMTSANNSASWLASISSLTPDMIENLPRQTVHLPPIHLPGSQANVNTELETVIFPAEIINPINGTLSIIRSDPTRNISVHGAVQSPFVLSAQPHFTNAPTNVQSPLAALAMASGPFMQQVQDLFQRVTSPQPQQTSLLPYNQASVQSPRPVLPQYNAQIIPPMSTMNRGSYPPANIQPIATPNTGSYNPTTFTPANAANIAPYPPANITPYRPINSTQYKPVNTTSYQPASIGPYSPANITPLNPTTSAPSTFSNIGSYQPANITPLNPTTSAPSNSSHTGPYRPANITPSSVGLNRPDDSSILPPSIPSASMPYSSSPPLNSSGSFNSSSSGVDHRVVNIPQSSQPLFQLNTPMPKSILRSTPSNRFPNTAYSRLNPPNMLSPTGIIRQMATVV